MNLEYSSQDVTMQYDMDCRYGGAQNLEELHAMLRGSVMVRRLKSDVLTELPEKRRQQIFLSLDASKRRELNALTKQFEAVKAAFAKMGKYAFHACALFIVSVFMHNG